MAAAAVPVNHTITTFNDLVQRNPQLQQMVQQALQIDLTVNAQFKSQRGTDKQNANYSGLNTEGCQEVIRQLSEKQAECSDRPGGSFNIDVTFSSGQLQAHFAWAGVAPAHLQIDSCCVIL